MKKTRFLFSLLMAIVMMAMSPQRLWALDGSGTSSSPYTIANASDLVAFASKVNGGETGAYGKLTADITLTSAWTPIGNSSKIYTGTFDGQGHKISGLSISGYTKTYQGFFGYVNNATIQNFSLAGSMSSSTQFTGDNDASGTVVGRANGSTKILNIVSSVNLTISTNKQNHIGGIVGYITGSTQVSGCTYSGTLDAGPSVDSNGGIVGFAYASCSGSITNCFFNGTVKSTGSDPQMGGILGYTNDTSNNFGGVQNCYSCGTITYSGNDKYANAIIGRIRAKSHTTINNTFLSGTATRACNEDCDEKVDFTTNKAITISVTAGSNGTVSQSYVNPTSTTATQLQVVATPNTGYHFDSWSDDSKDQTHNVGLTANVSLKANFGSWGAGAWTWGSDGKSATCTRTCSHDANHKSSKNLTLGSGITSKEKTAATCMTKGTTTYTATATVEGTQYTDTKDVQDIAALGHSYTSQTENATYLKTGATCTADAVYYYKCSRCTEKGSSTWTKSGSKLGHGKTKGYTPTYTWSNDINAHTCSFTLKCLDCNTNVVSNQSLTGTQTAHTDATCTTAGSTTYKVTGTYSATGSTAYNSDNSKTYTIALLGHSFTVQSTDATYQKSPATCTEDAVYFHKCSRCMEKGETFWTNTDTALGHAMTGHPHVDATCTAAGNEAYWTCSRSCCDGKLFKDEDGTQLWDGGEHIIPALGHDFTKEVATDATRYSNATCLSQASYWYTCSVCGEIEHNNGHTFFYGGYAGHNYGYLDEDTGMYSCFWCGRQQDNGGEEPIEPEPEPEPDPDPDDGGDVIEGEVVTVKCTGTDGSAGFENETYDKAFDGKTSTKWCHNTTNPWVEFTTASPVYVTGYKLSTANDTRNNSSRNPKNWVLKGWSAEKNAWVSLDTKTNDNTLGAVNEKEYRFDLEARTEVTYQRFRIDFTHSGLMQLSEISIMGIDPTALCEHVMTLHGRKEATCTTAGNEEYWTCSKPCCAGTYFKNEAGTERWNTEPVIAGGHDFSQEKAEEAYLHSPATCTAEAHYYYSCTRCNVSEEDANHTFAHGDKLEHVMAHHERKEATCATAGNEEYWTCSQLCCAGIYYKNETGTEKWDAEPVTSGHDFTQQKAEDVYLHSPATCTAQARYYYSCSRCDASEEDANHTFAHGTKLSHTLDANNTCTECGYHASTTSKAVYADGTLTFYHDESDHLSDGTVYALNTGTNTPGWDAVKTSITTVVFDKSFADARPTSCYRWFRSFSALTEIIGIEYLNTENVTNMGSMFSECKKLQSVDVSNFNTEKVTNMGSMFSYCLELKSLDVSNFNTEKVSTMSWMFYECKKLQSLDVSNFNTAMVSNMSNMFYKCSSLQSLDVTNFNTDKVTNMSYMFAYCSALQSIGNCKFNTAMVTNMGSMFYNCSKLQSLDVSTFNTVKVTDMSSMFYGCSNLQSLDVTNFNTDKVTDMYFMFGNCSALQSLDVTKFNTGNVTRMSNMFGGCGNLQSLDVTNFNTGKVTDMGGMFNRCGNLQSLDVTNFNTEKVTSMNMMFQKCSSLQSLDLSNFNTGNVTSMYNLFDGCSSLQSLDLSSFNTAKVTSMDLLFQNCTALEILEVNNFDMQKASSNNLFLGCSSLKTLTLKSVPFLKQGTFDTKFRGDGVTVNYKLDDNSVIYTGENYLPAATSAPTYTRRGIKNQWGTIVVPFEVGNGAGYDLYTLTSVSGNELTLTKVNGTLAANTPALIRLSEAPASPVGVTLTAASNAVDATGSLAGTPADGLTLTGSYGVMEITDKDGYIISNNMFWNIADVKGGNHVYCAPFRAYLAGTVSGGNSPQMLSISWEEATPTVIETIEAITSDEAEIYDINGRRITDLRQGVNVVKTANGKTRKVIIK